MPYPSKETKILNYLMSRRGQWCCTVDIEKATDITVSTISHILRNYPMVERRTTRPTTYPHRGGTCYRYSGEAE